MAEAERRRIGLGYGPIADMADLITTQGVWASGVRGLPNEMSGIFLRHSSIGLVILVNYDHPRSRKRFSYAHEYAHALLDRKTTSAIVSSKENSQEFIERRANAFAAAFLLPAEGVRWFLELLEKGEQVAATASPPRRSGTSPSRRKTDQHRGLSRLRIRTSCRWPITST